MTPLQKYTNTFATKQRDLAAAFGISQPHLSLLLTGKKRPSLKLALRIERLTKGAVPVDSWIYHQKNNKNTQ